MAIRIEIEKRVRKLARLHNLDERQPLTTLFRELQKQKIFDQTAIGGLENLVNYGNKAAHGMPVAMDALQWADTYAPEVLEALDEALGESVEETAP